MCCEAVILLSRDFFSVNLLKVKMASSTELEVLYSSQFTTGLRGFHVYKETVKWKPFKGQKISFKREMANKHDRFAVAGHAS